MTKHERELDDVTVVHSDLGPATTTIVAAPATGKKVRVKYFAFTVSGAGTVQFVSGANVSATYEVGVAGLVGPPVPSWFDGIDATLLSAVTTGAVDFAITVGYVLADV